jgi:hypothetical protein
MSLPLGITAPLQVCGDRRRLLQRVLGPINQQVRCAASASKEEGCRRGKKQGRRQQPQGYDADASPPLGAQIPANPPNISGLRVGRGAYAAATAPQPDELTLDACCAPTENLDQLRE